MNRQDILDALHAGPRSATSIAEALNCADMPALYTELVSMEGEQILTIESRCWTLKTLRHSEALDFMPEMRNRLPAKLMQVRQWQERVSRVSVRNSADIRREAA
jgi:hypothetical protein